MQVLLERLRLLWASGDEAKLPLPDAALPAFLQHCAKKIGDSYFRTPRNTIRAFLDLLAILQQNPGASWTSLLDGVDIKTDEPGPQADIPDDSPTPSQSGRDDLASFRL
jgi:hypothetical protein